jgi:hypothetical protein
MVPLQVAEMERWWRAHREILSMRIAAASLALFMAATSLFLAVQQTFALFQLEEVGYGDSYILYDAHHFQQTGVVYRDLSQPPYLPAQYGPLVYVMYSIPRWNAFGNPYFGPRLLAMGAFLLCVAMSVSIARTLNPARYVWLWSLLLAVSIQLMIGWIQQLRGDFAAVFFGLAAVRLLLAKPRYAVLLAGLSAGFATQFKFVYVTSLLAGSLWLLFQKRFREFGLFAAAGTLSSIGLYFLLWLREPRMIAQMLALSPGIPDFWGWVRILLMTVQTPIVLLALPALPFLLSRKSPRWMLLALFATISFAIASVTLIQAGGAPNYYFEWLFALVPLATFGTLQLLSWSRTNTGLAIFIAGVALTQFLVRATGTQVFHSPISPGALRAQNDSFRRLRAVLRDEKVFSVVPSIALLDPHPVLMDGYLASYLKRLGKFDMQPLLERLGAGEFDVVITPNGDPVYRGIRLIDPVLRAAMNAKYQPHCTILNDTLYLRRDPKPSQTLVDSLRDIGCQPTVLANSPTDFAEGGLE